MSRRISEASMGPPVIAHLEGEGWDVYQEVPGPFGGTADIVATNGRLLGVVEMKVGLGFDVIDQALRWLRFAHWTWVAVPSERVGSSARHLARRVCEDFGIGVIEVRDDMAHEVAKPSIQRRADVARLRDRLRPEHKTFAKAGTASGRAWTPFKETCKSVRGYLAANGGRADLSALLSNVKTHYSSSKVARACIVQWAERGKIPGVTVDRSERRLRLALTPEDEKK